MYPENPEGTQVIVGSVNMGYISDAARNRSHNLFRPKRVSIPLGNTDGLHFLSWSRRSSWWWHVRMERRRFWFCGIVDKMEHRRCLRRQRGVMEAESGALPQQRNIHNGRLLNLFWHPVSCQHRSRLASWWRVQTGFDTSGRCRAPPSMSRCRRNRRRGYSVSVFRRIFQLRLLSVRWLHSIFRIPWSGCVVSFRRLERPPAIGCDTSEHHTSRSKTYFFL